MMGIIGCLVVSCMFAGCTVLPSTSTNDIYAHDVAFLSDDHIIVSEWYGGVVVTRDGGATWIKRPQKIVLEQLRVGEKGRIWGFHAWQGIHEPSEAMLAISFDGGDSWDTIDLDPEKVMPVSFINEAGTKAVLLAENGQLLTPSPEQPNKMWQKLGESIPEGNAKAGIVVDQQFYIASTNCIWFSTDFGQSWTAAPITNIVAFAQNDDFIWAISADGIIFKCYHGSNEWARAFKMPSITLAFSLAASDRQIIVAAEGDGWVAYGAIATMDGKTRILPGMHGKQAYSVRKGPNGSIWCVADGLYVEQNDRWFRIWPKD